MREKNGKFPFPQREKNEKFPFPDREKNGNFFDFPDREKNTKIRFFPQGRKMYPLKGVKKQVSLRSTGEVVVR